MKNPPVLPGPRKPDVFQAFAFQLEGGLEKTHAGRDDYLAGWVAEGF